MRGSAAMLSRDRHGDSVDPASTVRWPQLLYTWRHLPHLGGTPPGVTAFMSHRATQQGLPAPEPVQWTALEAISPYLLCAVIGAEDPAFFRHRGISWRQVGSAVVRAYVEKRPVTGVSTLTQQLARNLYLHPERSLKRKTQEAILALRIEHLLTKRRILELYLNVVEWGDGIWGIAAAAKSYFNRQPAELDPFQAVVLASLLPAPRRAVRDSNADRAIRTQRRLMFTLYGSGYMSRDEEHETLARIARLEIDLRAGVPFRAVCQELTKLPYESFVPERRSITVLEVMDSECGSAAQSSFVQFIHDAPTLALALDARPMWWSPSCASPADRR